MSTAAEIQLKAEAAAPTAARLIELFEGAWQRELEQLAAPRYIVMPPWVSRIWLEAIGHPRRRHARARGARGRKRALLSSWRPIGKGPRVVIKQEHLPWASVIS